MTTPLIRTKSKVYFPTLKQPINILDIFTNLLFQSYQNNLLIERFFSYHENLISLRHTCFVINSKSNRGEESIGTVFICPLVNWHNCL